MGNTSYSLGATEVVNVSAVSAASGVHGDPQPYQALGGSVVRIQADVACFIVVGPAPVATVNTGFPVAPGVYEYIDIPPGHKLAAITASGTGKLYITSASKR